MLDWNIFYSSLAQSTATFVGLLGAFIFTKIINNEQQYNENKILIEEYINIANNLKLRLSNRYFYWYNIRTKEKALEKFIDDVYNDNEILSKSPEIIYNDYSFSEFDSKSEILNAIKKQQEILLKEISNKNKQAGMLYIAPKRIPHIANIELMEKLNDEREEINKLISEVSLHKEKALFLYKRLIDNPQSSKIITNSIYISLWLVICCISIPFFIIPIDTHFIIFDLINIVLNNLVTVKGLFITMLTILICSLFIYFLYKNYKMTYSKDDLLKLLELSKLENYSEYLKNYVENVTIDNN